MQDKRAILISASMFLVIFCSAASKGETVYFLVAEIIPYHGDSYILPLTEPSDIAYARNLVQYGYEFGPHIVVADIAAGADGINRDYFNPIKERWSWHVTQFDGFAASTIEILDGWPGLVQNDVQWWITNTGGQIGFWAYTVVAELGINPRHWECDFVSDNHIDFKDYAILSSYWLNDECLIGSWCGGTDLDKNGVVDVNDLRAFGGSWLSSFASEPVWYSVWNCPYQCHGDADCAVETVGKVTYRVSQNDLNILLATWGSGYDPRADFDRDGDIDANDQEIYNYWYQSNSVPADCPTQP